MNEITYTLPTKEYVDQIGMLYINDDDDPVYMYILSEVISGKYNLVNLASGNRYFSDNVDHETIVDRINSYFRKLPVGTEIKIKVKD